MNDAFLIGVRNEQSNIKLAQYILNLIYPSKPYEELIQYVDDRLGHDFRYALDNSKLEKKLDKKLSKQDRIIKDFQRLQKQMKTHLELYKTSESEENKKTALQMLKNLTPEFQAAKKAYEKLKGVKI